MIETGPAFEGRGFYLHAAWQYEYPFAVRRWDRDDYAGMFRLLCAMGFNHVMIWPMTELAPPPLSPEDRRHFETFREVVRSARDLGLECWLVFCANLTTTENVRADAFQDRVLYPNMRKLRLDDAAEFKAYMKHMRAILGCINNADGYVFIDGDPGGYPGAVPRDFMRMLEGVRSIIQSSAVGTPKIIPWVWSGWGSNGEEMGNIWDVDLQQYVRPFLAALREQPPKEPWELLLGRSIRDGHANGRVNVVLGGEADLLNRSTLLTYEIIEFEPTPPAFVVQFSDIRRVIREELPLAPTVRGIMGNAQQPVCAIQNLFYFSRCVDDPQWLDKTDEEVLSAFAEFLGGDASVLVPAWQSSQRGLHEIPVSLSAKVREGTLTSDAAQLLPGGPSLYLTILAEFVETRRAILKHTRRQPCTADEAGQQLAEVAVVMLRWWGRHRYVSTGDLGTEFRWKFVNRVLMEPLYEWLQRLAIRVESVSEEVAERMAETGLITRATAGKNVIELLSRMRA